MTLIFIMTSEVWRRGRDTKKYARELVLLLLLFFPLFLSSYFPLYCTFISYFCFDLACSLRQTRLLKKDKVKVDFLNSIFSSLFSILGTSGIFPVCVLGQYYERTR